MVRKAIPLFEQFLLESKTENEEVQSQSQEDDDAQAQSEKEPEIEDEGLKIVKGKIDSGEIKTIDDLWDYLGSQLEIEDDEDEDEGPDGEEGDVPALNGGSTFPYSKDEE